jgi:hypothetical protein
MTEVPLHLALQIQPLTTVHFRRERSRCFSAVFTSRKLITPGDRIVDMKVVLLKEFGGLLSSFGIR